MSLELARLPFFWPSPLLCSASSTSITITTPPVVQFLDSSNVATSHRRGIHPLFLVFFFLVVGTALLTLLGIKSRANPERGPNYSHQLRPLPQYLAPWRLFHRALKGAAFKLMHPATPWHPLLRSLYATIILYCNSDDFSWALLHAVYLSLVSADLSASTWTCKRVTVVDLGRLSEEVACEGLEGKRSTHAYASLSHGL